MAASSNESFGLKIATALSIALTVILLVAVYFLNSGYNMESEKNAAAQKKIGELNGNIRDVTTQANEYRRYIGYEAIEDFEAVKAQMKKDQEQLNSEIQAIKTEIAGSIDEFKKKIETKGVDASQFEALKQRANEVAEGYSKNPDQSYKASLVRLKDLTVNQAKLNTNLALSYIDLRRDLDLANQINSTQKKVVEDAYASAKTELDATIRKDEDARADLVKVNREQADKLATLDTNITNLTNEMNQKGEESAKKTANLKSIVRDLQDLSSRKEDVMTKPGGRVTYVDYASKTVRVNINRAQGVRPLMRFTIFDKNSAGASSEKPKAAIELVSVGDPQRGENDSLARIVKTENPADPIRYNDFIYSVGWSYDHPQRFALIGKLDVNRDGRDDRGDLIPDDRSLRRRHRVRPAPARGRPGRRPGRRGPRLHQARPAHPAQLRARRGQDLGPRLRLRHRQPAHVDPQRQEGPRRDQGRHRVPPGGVAGHQGGPRQQRPPAGPREAPEHAGLRLFQPGRRPPRGVRPHQCPAAPETQELDQPGRPGRVEGRDPDALTSRSADRRESAPPRR